MANSENWVSGLLASPADANFHERYQMLSGSKSFEQLLSDIHLVNTGVLLKWLDRLDTSSTGETDSSLELVVSACLIDLARRNQPEVTHLFVKLRKFCIEPDAFRSIAENLVLIDPSQTAALIDQSKRENIKGIGSGCGSGLLAYLRASGDLEATLKNSEYLPVVERSLFFERMDLPHLVENGHTLPEIIDGFRSVGKSDGSGFGAAIWQKLGSSFEVGDVVASAGSELNDSAIQSLAKGVISRDPGDAVKWLIENGERDTNHTIFNAVVREWVAVDTARASEQLGEITSAPHLRMAAKMIAQRAEAEGNHAVAAEWLRIASKE